MSANVNIAILANDADWELLRQAIEPKLTTESVQGILKKLSEAKAKGVVIENEYLDRDYTTAFTDFYAKAFKRHTKLCRRFHFFSSDISKIFQETNPSELSSKLENAGVNGGYLGFIVIRPTAHAPISSAVIALPQEGDALRSYVLVRAKYEVHLLGATFEIEGFPFTQQDSRVGACAQAAIWMAGRHFHVRHRGPWVSTSEITQFATKNTDENLSRSLPAGSEFLGLNHMVEALRSMGREPFTYSGLDPHTMKINWGPKLQPKDIINRYVDSGIPVILALFNNQSEGHAVIACGHSLKKINPKTVLPTTPTRAEFCEAFLINDDQGGANLKMPVDLGSAVADSTYSINQNVGSLIIPLPDKVYVPAEWAETIAWDLLDMYGAKWDEIKKHFGDAIKRSIDLGDQVIHDRNANQVIARTYLTYGWKYKSRMLRNSIGEEFKSALLYQEMPKYLWVTEFGSLDSLNCLEHNDRKIYSHVAVDATASKHWEQRCMFHAPGFGKRWHHNPNDMYGDYVETVIPIAEDVMYSPKVRGE